MSDDRRQLRIDSLATAASIVLYELERDGMVLPYTRLLLAAALDAYNNAGSGSLITTPDEAARLAAGAMRIAKLFDDGREE